MSKINGDFWLKTTQKSFTHFFNTNNAGKMHWGVGRNGEQQKIQIVSNGDKLLSDIFSNSNISLITGKSDMNIFQFLIMVSVILNETGGALSTTVGEYGSLEYTFNVRGGQKSSYNAKNSLGNKTAFELFHNPTFMNLPARALMIKPKNIEDPAWKGTLYPSNEKKGGYNAKDNYSVGLISECDFYKFRGRGLIQLTGRANYIEWMRKIRDNKNTIQYSNNDSLGIINSWGSTDMNIIATKITNLELDKLFSDRTLSYYTLKTHESSNKVLQRMYNVEDPSTFLELAKKYGKKISGSEQYGVLFANRIVEIMQYVPNLIKA